VRIGTRFGDADLIAMARHVQARALVDQGQVPAGLDLLDETMLPVVAGELFPILTGLLYCSVIERCQRVYAMSRAREWTLAFSRWCERQSEALALTGRCLVDRAEIQLFHGAWPEALADASRACERAARANRKPPATALYQQGEIYRLRGEHREAEKAYRAASQRGYDPQPGLALLRLAQGQLDAACAAMRRTLRATNDRLQRARLLPACVEVLLAAGEVEESRSACRELHELSNVFDADVLRAAAAQTTGATQLAERKEAAALGPPRHAFELWTHLDAPHEAACVRVQIALACRALGDEETAGMEFAGARSTFRELTARTDLTRVDTLEGRRTSGHDARLSPRETEVLRLVAAGHTNKVIAARLGVSERTVDRHVTNILTKLDVSSRTAATASAYEHELL
jgi:DNA-binding CsgD family transcriptional regulator